MALVVKFRKLRDAFTISDQQFENNFHIFNRLHHSLKYIHTQFMIIITMTRVIINDEFSDINNAKRHSQQQRFKREREKKMKLYLNYDK